MEKIEGEVKTDVDELVELVSKKGKVSLHEISRSLKKSPEIIQSWVDFLIEENVLGVEYKFITPYFYIIKKAEGKKTILDEPEGDSVEDKKAFFQKAKSRGLDSKKINDLWKQYLEKNLDLIKESFIAKAKSKNFSEQKIGELWKKYYDYLKKEE